MATYYFINGGTDNNWSTNNNWSLTSGGSPVGNPPTNTDDVALDNNSPNCIVDSLSTANIINFDCTGYVNTLTLQNSFSVNGNFILSSAMTFVTTNVNAYLQIVAPNNDINVNTFGKTINCPTNTSTTGDGITYYTMTLLSPLIINNTLGTQQSIFTGSYGFTANSITIFVLLTLTSGVTYTVIGTASCSSSYSQPTIVNTTIPGSRAILNVGSISSNLQYCSATDIDSSGGSAIYTYKGILNNTLNWYSVITPKAIGATFIN